jgi:multidrug efflux pump subunit AcrA (membrane-fusion protein)
VREEQTQRLTQLDFAKDEATLNQRTIRSPMDGIITEKKLSAAEFVNQGRLYRRRGAARSVKCRIEEKLWSPCRRHRTG